MATAVRIRIEAVPLQEESSITMFGEASEFGPARKIAPAEQEWRNALRAAGYAAPQPPLRIHPSQLLTPGGDKQAAEQAYRRFVAAEPENLMGLDGLAFLLQHRGAWQEAQQVRRQRYAAEARNLGVPDDELAAVVDFMAASLGDGERPVSAPAAYVAKMFDDAAETYDQRLVEGLAYRGPELLFDAVSRTSTGAADGLNVLDLGCGTGLAGAVFRRIARRLTGVDLSPEMLTQARRRGCYDELHQQEIAEFLAVTDDRFDLIIAADVLVYLGDLRPVFAAMAGALRHGGRCAVTVERGEDAEFRLRGTRRYQHARRHLEEAADEAGLTRVLLEEVELRREQGEPVRSWLGVWRRQVVRLS